MGIEEKDRPRTVGLQLNKLPAWRRLASQTPVSEVGRFAGSAALRFVGGVAARQPPRLRKLSGEAANHCVLCFVNTQTITSECVAFGDRIALMLLGRIRLARASITLAHIWRPEKPGDDLSLRLLEFCRSAQFPNPDNSDARANLTPAHVWRPPTPKEQL